VKTITGSSKANIVVFFMHTVIAAVDNSSLRYIRAQTIPSDGSIHDALLNLYLREITLHDSSLETDLDMLVTAVHLEARLPDDWTGHLASSNFSH